MVNSAVLCNTWKTQEYVWSECSPAPAVGQGNTPASARSHRCLTSCFPIIWEDFCPSCSHYSVHYVQHNHSALLIRKPLICFKTSSMNNFLWKSTEILPPDHTSVSLIQQGNHTQLDALETLLSFLQKLLMARTVIKYRTQAKTISLDQIGKKDANDLYHCLTWKSNWWSLTYE